MMPFAPVQRRHLGQLDLASGLTSSLARSIVAEAEPATRRVIKEERTKFAEALIGGLPWASVSAITALATYYLVKPEPKIVKFLGYGTSAALLGVGSLLAISDLREPSSGAAPKPPGIPGVQSVAEKAAAAVVAEAEPKIRVIVAEERTRLAEAVQAGLPLAALGALTMIGTLLVVKPEKRLYKVLGYTASTLLVTAGAWVALEREKE